ncbi:MAG: hypothetical protein ACRDQW_02200 [Haloechinothrix sp.]
MDVKKVAIIVVAALLLFYVISNPAEAAGGVQTILGWLGDAANQIITFIEQLFA